MLENHPGLWIFSDRVTRENRSDYTSTSLALPQGSKGPCLEGSPIFRQAGQNDRLTRVNVPEKELAVVGLGNPLYFRGFCKESVGHPLCFPIKAPR